MSRGGLLGDVSVTHPVHGSGEHRGEPQPVVASRVALSAASDREAQKARKYGLLCQAQDYDFVPLVLETYGGFGPCFTRLLEEMATFHVRRTWVGRAADFTAEFDDSELASDLVAARLFGRLRARSLRRWRARLSLVLARSVGDRLLGSCTDSLAVGDGVQHWAVGAGV